MLSVPVGREVVLKVATPDERSAVPRGVDPL
jgi:hypothetical protein